MMKHGKIAAMAPALLSLGACLGNGDGPTESTGLSLGAAHAPPTFASTANLPFFGNTTASGDRGRLKLGKDGTTHVVNSIKLSSNTVEEVIFTDPAVGSHGNFNVYRQDPVADFVDEVVLLLDSAEHNLSYVAYGVWAESDAINTLLSTGSTTLTGIGAGATYFAEQSATNLPASGTASFAGEAVAFETDTSGATPTGTLYSGTVTMTADWGGGRASPRQWNSAALTISRPRVLPELVHSATVTASALPLLMEP